MITVRFKEVLMPKENTRTYVVSKSNEICCLYYTSNTFYTWPHCVRNLSHDMEHQSNLARVQRNLNLEDIPAECAFLLIYFHTTFTVYT